MSLLSGLDESEHSPDKGWADASRFGIGDTADIKDGWTTEDTQEQSLPFPEAVSEESIEYVQQTENIESTEAGMTENTSLPQNNTTPSVEKKSQSILYTIVTSEQNSPVVSLSIPNIPRQSASSSVEGNQHQAGNQQVKGRPSTQQQGSVILNTQGGQQGSVGVKGQQQRQFLSGQIIQGQQLQHQQQQQQQHIKNPKILTMKAGTPNVGRALTQADSQEERASPRPGNMILNVSSPQLVGCNSQQPQRAQQKFIIKQEAINSLLLNNKVAAPGGCPQGVLSGSGKIVRMFTTGPKVFKQSPAALQNSRGNFKNNSQFGGQVHQHKALYRGAQSYEALPLSTSNQTHTILSVAPNSAVRSQETGASQRALSDNGGERFVLEGGRNFEDNEGCSVENQNGIRKSVHSRDGQLYSYSTGGSQRIQMVPKGQIVRGRPGNKVRGKGRGGHQGQGRGRGRDLHGNATGYNMAPVQRNQPGSGELYTTQGQRLTGGQTIVVNTKNIMPAATGSQQTPTKHPSNLQHLQGVNKGEGEGPQPISEKVFYPGDGQQSEHNGGSTGGQDGSGDRLGQGEGNSSQHGQGPDSREENSDEGTEDFASAEAKDPNKYAVCQFCGYSSFDLAKCERCSRRFNSDTKYYNNSNLNPSKRKLDSSPGRTGEINKRTFYGTNKIESPSGFRVINNNNPSILRGNRGGRRGLRGRGRGRPRGRGHPYIKRFPVVPETVTISSDEEDGGHGHGRHPLAYPAHAAVAGSMPSPAQNHNTQSDDEEDEDEEEELDFPDIPNHGTSLTRRKMSRVAAMEDMDGNTKKGKRPLKMESPLEITLAARAIRVGSFKGAPIEPVLMSKEGINFYVEGQQKSHRFHICTNELRQCLANFDEGTCSLFFLTSPQCAGRIRKDLGMKNHMDPNTPPPEPYFDPSDRDMTHQLIMISVNGMDPDTKRDYMKITDSYIQNSDQDDSFFIELNRGETESVLNQMTQKRLVQPPSATTPPVAAQLSDHGYSCSAEEEKNNLLLQQNVGFKGPVVKLLTYPPPPATGGITITNEDLYCLNEGEFLNDVIIDFYLKYLFLEKLSEADRKRTHIFSSFFFKRLSQRICRNFGEEDDPSQTLANKRHARVKTWTRHVDLFSKDFIIVPINEHAHWFLAIICFPGLEETQHIPYLPSEVPQQQETGRVPTPTQTPDLAEEAETPEPMDTQSENPLPEENVQQPTKSESPGPMDTSELPTDSAETSQETDVSTTANMGDTPDGTEAKDSQSNQSAVPGPGPTPSPGPAPSPSSAPSPSPAPSSSSTKMSYSKVIRGQILDKAVVKEASGYSIGLQQPCILVFDSLAGPSRSKIVTILKEYLQVEYAVKKNGEYRREKVKGSAPRSPQQNNYSDCGVFVLQYVESFFEDPIQDFATPMKGLTDWFPNERIDVKREELKNLILGLKEKYEKKLESAGAAS